MNQPSTATVIAITDHPVLRLNYESVAQYDVGGGWGHPDSGFILPVSAPSTLATLSAPGWAANRAVTKGTRSRGNAS